MSMRVIVVGCGEVGSALALQLYQKGHQVTIIDQNEAAFDNLAIDFKGRIIEGDVLARNVWQRAEIENADAFAAVTGSDSLNALVAHIAKTEFKVHRVIARNKDARQLALQEAFGIPIIGTTSWETQQGEELLTDVPLHAVLIDSQAGLSIYHLEVPAHWHGHTMEEQLPADRYEKLSWTRLGHALPIDNKQTLERGDLVYLRASPEEIDALRNRLSSEQEKSV
jgi:trk/ktr system potassium uptake protein